MSITVTPHLWFDKEAVEAAHFYCALFPESVVEHSHIIRGTPSGDCTAVSFRIAGQPFQAISAGPLFTFTPAISFILNFDPGKAPDAREQLDKTWAQLAEGGEVLMPLGTYPFSERYGWVQDRFGVSWQLILSRPEGEPRPFVVPSLLFTGEVCGRAEEAAEFYRSVFEDSAAGGIFRYGPGMEPDQEGTVMFTDFRLGTTWLAAMDSAHRHDFGFNEAVSFIVPCENQAEIDHYWALLSTVPESEQCGWCKDRFGVSWQIVPVELSSMMSAGTGAQIERVTRAFLNMKKMDVAALRRAYEGDET